MKKYLILFSVLFFGLLFILPAQAQTVPKMTIAKMVSPDPVATGAELTYTINFTISDAAVTGLVLTDEIPANTTFVSASDPGKYDAATNKVTWNYGNYGQGNHAVVLKVKVYSPLANGTVIKNTATIDSNETEPLTDSVETTVSSAPVLTMEKTVDKAKAVAGEMIYYTVKITNSGTDTAKNVQLNDALPAGFILENNSYNMAYNFGDIATGESKATTYTVKIDTGITAGNYTNTASVTADNHSEITDSVDVYVTLPIVLGEEIVEKPAPQEEVKPLVAEEEIKVLGEEEELVATGIGLLNLIGGLILIGTGLFLRKKIE